MQVKQKLPNPPGRAAGGDHGQMPPTPACPERQRYQLATKGKK